MQAETIVRLLTISSLAGLLGAIGLRLTLTEVAEAVRRCRFWLILGVNFTVIPLLAAAAARIFSIRGDIAVGMVLLGASPFAPVVPVFARMARADLPLAAGLTSIFPVFCAVLAPVSFRAALFLLPESQAIRFDMLAGLFTLLATITLPLGAGIAFHRVAPRAATRLLRPVEIVSESTGALSLAFVTVTELDSILQTGWVALFTMVIVAEASQALGYWLGGPGAASRRVVALGTSNRNIALALLIAIQSFPGTPIISAVVANGLVLIFLGLAHVACWRLIPSRREPAGVPG